MRSKRALIISLVLAGIAVLLINVYINNRIGYIQKRYKTVQIVVASKDIPQYVKIDETMLELKDVPEPYVEPNALADKKARIGFLSAITIKEGEQITEQKLARPEEMLSTTIPKDMRAITIAINEISGVAGLIRPLDRVDIIGIFKTLDEKSKDTSSAESVTLFQNVQVLSVGRSYMVESIKANPQDKDAASKGGGTSFSNITLLMTPRECMELSLAQDSGSLSLILRPLFDYDPPRTYPELKDKRSNIQSITGIKEKLDLSPSPKWLEQRGEKSLWVR